MNIINLSKQIFSDTYNLNDTEYPEHDPGPCLYEINNLLSDIIKSSKNTSTEKDNSTVINRSNVKNNLESTASFFTNCSAVNKPNINKSNTTTYLDTNDVFYTNQTDIQSDSFFTACC